MIIIAMELLKKWKEIGIGILMVGILIFLIGREINKSISEKENETIEINTINLPSPSEFDRICMSDTNKQCESIGKSEVRKPWYSW